MTWKVAFAPNADRQLRKLERDTQRRIVRFLDERVATGEDPRRMGEALHGTLRVLWKYRVGDFRLICDIQDRVVTVLVLDIGDRRQVYKKR